MTTRIEDLEGVGPTRAKHFKHLGVETLADLLDYFPHRYQFESSELSIDKLVSDQIQTARGTVCAVDYVMGRGRPRFEATIEDGTEKLSLVWFNASYLRNKIYPGMTIRVQGRVKVFRNIPQMANPKWRVVDEETPRMEEEKFRPIYPASASLHSDVIGKVIEDNLDAILEPVGEWFAPPLLKKRRLIGRREAYRQIHRPANNSEVNSARRRIIYNELMLMQLGLGMSKRLRAGRLTAPVMRMDKTLDERIRRRFPFEMTVGQQNACYDIVRDLAGGQPMNRLLQGDVGSGKTAVALYAMLVAVANKMQAALLAPTEVLAEQHFFTLSTFLRDSSVGIELLTSRTKRANKSAIQKNLLHGKAHLAVGTQALIQEDIEFANLGIVVVDEQHKLGVRQRETLKGKGLSPHYLVMTATPIPRTLALSYFADFDLSVISELPPGRQPIETRWLRANQAQQAYDFLRKQISAGRQAYIVLPQIDDDGTEDVKSVAKEFARLSKGPLAGLRLAQLHGQMSTDEKHETMTAFRAGKIDALVATTVIEVGIDVPKATLMLIDNADRFGLSQLHQLRGRVGRGSEKSYCILLGDPQTESAETRLQTMTETGDGFEIAEMDLKLRGPGQFFGTRQHGLPEFKMADLSAELALLQLAREDAMEILAGDPNLASVGNRNLRSALHKQFGDTLELAQIG